jgi:hypothetical protein
MGSLINRNRIEYINFTIVIIIGEIAIFYMVYIYTYVYIIQSIFACKIWIHLAVSLCNLSHEAVL